MYRHAVAGVFLLMSVISIARAQSLPTGPPQAVSLAQQAVQALTRGATIADVTLTGNIISNLVSDNENGTATFRAKGTAESRLDLALPSGTQTEIRDAQTGPPQNQWISASQNPQPAISRNCSTDAVWFFPALTSLGGNSNRLFKYIGAETRNGMAVQHIRSYKSDPMLPLQVQLRYESLTAVDFYLDSKTLIPVALSFNVHPDDGSDVDLPVVVEFSNYQNISGLLVPMRVQKYLQGNLLLDFTVSNVAVNSGLTLATFAIQPAQVGQ